MRADARLPRMIGAGAGGGGREATTETQTQADMRSDACAAAAGLATKAQSPLLQADVAVAPDDDVVKHLDVKQAPGLDDLFGDAHIFRAGRWVAGGMVMEHNDAGGVEADGVAKDLADAHDGCVQVAFVERDDADERVLGVENGHPKLLLFQLHHFEHYEIGGIRRAAYGWRVGLIEEAAGQARPQLERRLDLRSFGRPDAGMPGQLFQTFAPQIEQAAGIGDQLLRDIERIGARSPGADGDGEQFAVVECAGAGVGHAGARLQIDGQVTQNFAHGLAPLAWIATQRIPSLCAGRPCC